MYSPMSMLAVIMNATECCNSCTPCCTPDINYSELMVGIPIYHTTQNYLSVVRGPHTSRELVKLWEDFMDTMM